VQRRASPTFKPQSSEYYRPIKHAFLPRKILSLGSAVSVVEFNLDLCRSMWMHQSAVPQGSNFVVRSVDRKWQLTAHLARCPTFPTNAR
jgi:hypothetical protein